MDIRFAGEAGTTPYRPTGDNGQNSTRLQNVNTPPDGTGNNVFLQWVAQGMPNANTTIWTAYYSGVTGNVVAIEPWVPSFATGGELVMVTHTAWDSTVPQVGQAQFVRANGETRALGAALPMVSFDPLNPVTGQAIQTAFAEMRGTVAWAVEFNGVYYLRQLVGSDVSTLGAPNSNNMQVWYVGEDLDQDIWFGNATDTNIYMIEDTLAVVQSRTLNTSSRFILSDGSTSLFPNAPAGQSESTAFGSVVFILDAATLERVETVFVVTMPLYNPA